MEQNYGGSNHNRSGEKRDWKKPKIMTLSQKELKAHIQAAANSFCKVGWNR